MKQIIEPGGNDLRQIQYEFLIYYRILYKINQNFIMLCGIDVYQEAIRDDDKSRKLLMDVLCGLFRILPCHIEGENIKLEERDALYDMGIERMNASLGQKYCSLIQKNGQLLYLLKTLRNKYEHVPHIIKEVSRRGGIKNGKLDYSFYYMINDKEFEIKGEDLRILIIKINEVFEEIKEYISSKQSDKYYDFVNLSSYDFDIRTFNSILNCDLLWNIGRIMRPL